MYFGNESVEHINRYTSTLRYLYNYVAAKFTIVYLKTSVIMIIVVIRVQFGRRAADELRNVKYYKRGIGTRVFHTSSPLSRLFITKT